MKSYTKGKNVTREELTSTISPLDAHHHDDKTTKARLS